MWKKVATEANKRLVIELTCLFIMFLIASRICNLLQLSTTLQWIGVDIIAIGISTILSDYIYKMLPKADDKVELIEDFIDDNKSWDDFWDNGITDDSDDDFWDNDELNSVMENFKVPEE